VAQEPELRPLLFGPPDAWERWLGERPLAEPDPAAESAFLTAAEPFVRRYFDLEDPDRLEPAEREVSVSSALPSGLVLRGIIDRLDRAPNGAIRVVDYKTGRSPGVGWEAKAMFQMRFYGLMLWRLHGTIPARLQLLYLGNNERLTLDPTEHELRATQSKVQALWTAIERATATQTWPARPSRLCDWCSFHALCPEQGGTPPPLPEPLGP
jgi:putative RecB family exonuclease